MTTYRPIDSKREEFRKYLERAGVMDALTKALVLLYEEPDKPEDALEYLRVNLGDKRPTMQEIDTMKRDLEESAKRIKELEAEVARLRGEELEDEEGEDDPTTTEGMAGLGLEDAGPADSTISNMNV